MIKGDIHTHYMYIYIRVDHMRERRELLLILLAECTFIISHYVNSYYKMSKPAEKDSR